MCAGYRWEQEECLIGMKFFDPMGEKGIIKRTKDASNCLEKMKEGCK